MSDKIVKHLLAGLTSVFALNAGAASIHGLLFQKNDFIGKSHGGNIDDIDSYSDGVGVFVKQVSGDAVDFKKFNQTVFSRGAEAKEIGRSVAEIAGLSGEDLGKTFDHNGLLSLNGLISAYDSAVQNGEDVSEIKLRIENFDVSDIDDFSGLFANSSFNGDLSRWNVKRGQRETTLPQTFLGKTILFIQPFLDGAILMCCRQMVT